jgi:hypothetical protein
MGMSQNQSPSCPVGPTSKIADLHHDEDKPGDEEVPLVFGATDELWSMLENFFSSDKIS